MSPIICLRYTDMNRDELMKLIVYLRERIEETGAAHKREGEERKDVISTLTVQMSTQAKKIFELTSMLRKS